MEPLPDISELITKIEALQRSDARQTRLLRQQRLVQSSCIVALGLAIALGYAGFSSANRETVERLVIGIVGASCAGHLGSNFVDRVRDDEGEGKQ